MKTDKKNQWTSSADTREKITLNGRTFYKCTDAEVAAYKAEYNRLYPNGDADFDAVCEAAKEQNNE
jgi:hypothetical protein